MAVTIVVLKNVDDGNVRTVVVGVDEGPPVGYHEYGLAIPSADLAGKTGPQKLAVLKAAVAPLRAQVLADAQRPQSDLPPTIDVP